jgi:hypothetical protein
LLFEEGKGRHVTVQRERDNGACVELERQTWRE